VAYLTLEPYSWGTTEWKNFHLVASVKVILIRAVILASEEQRTASTIEARNGGSHRALAYFSQEKICFQSFFMLMTVQPLALASSYKAWLKVPTLVSGNPAAGP
jgi:hypothetical protein